MIKANINSTWSGQDFCAEAFQLNLLIGFYSIVILIYFGDEVRYCELDEL